MSSLFRKVGTLLGIRFAAIREINQRYAHPRIVSRRVVSVSLLVLRLYLFFVIAVLFYKFFTLIA
ncbi:MAG: hypothetical protein V1926_01955 [Candidatus Peregrinibacteria bacterium]